MSTRRDFTIGLTSGLATNVIWWLLTGGAAAIAGAILALLSNPQVKDWYFLVASALLWFVLMPIIGHFLNQACNRYYAKHPEIERMPRAPVPMTPVLQIWRWLFLGSALLGMASIGGYVITVTLNS